MTYNSLPFLFVFFPLFYITYFLLARTRLKNLVLLAGSLAFVVLAGSPLTPAGIKAAALVNVPVLGAVVLANYGFGRLVERSREDERRKKTWQVVGVSFNVALLAVVKIGVYLQQNYCRAARAAGHPGRGFHHPLGNLVYLLSIHRVPGGHQQETHWQRAQPGRLRLVPADVPKAAHRTDRALSCHPQ